MAIATGAATAVDVIKERWAPALDTLDERIRQGRRAVVRGRHAVEDAAAATTQIVRTRPLRAVMIAAGARVFTGGVLGFGLGWLARNRK